MLVPWRVHISCHMKGKELGLAILGTSVERKPPKNTWVNEFGYCNFIEFYHDNSKEFIYHGTLYLK